MSRWDCISLGSNVWYKSHRSGVIFASLAFLAVFTAIVGLVPAQPSTSAHKLLYSPSGLTQSRSDLRISNVEVLTARAPAPNQAAQCRQVRSAIDQCNFILKNCVDEEAGLFSILQLNYCKIPKAKPIALIIMVLWLAILFSTIGITASDYFCVLNPRSYSELQLIVIV